MDREGWKQRALACELQNEELAARVVNLEAQPMETASRTGDLVRAWDRCVGRWVDIRWKYGRWGHDTGGRFAESSLAHPTCWRREPIPNEGEIN